MTELKSPTCGKCARKAGYIPVIGAHTVSEGVCANCGGTAVVSTAWDWKRPGERRHPDDWD